MGEIHYPGGRKYSPQPGKAEEKSAKEKKPPKYHNIKTIYLGIPFASQLEANRYAELLMMERAGLIRNIELQPRYNFVVNGRFVGFYKADFRYQVVATSATVVEDAKGMRNSTYALKKKLMRAIYGIVIQEV